MVDNDESLLHKLQGLLKQKKSKKFYAEKLNISIDYLEELLKELKIPAEALESSAYVDIDKGTIKSDIEVSFEVRDHKELAKLHKIDLTKYKISSYWSKLKTNGKFTSSVLATLKKDEDVLKENLLQDLKKIFKNTKVWETKVSINEEKSEDVAVFCYIADDHAGIDFKESLFNSPYTGEIYKERLLKVADNIISFNQASHIFIVNLGDELDGFNAQTTRGGHSLDSLPNRDQFNIYTSARKEFYDKVIQNSNGARVTIININNSNHSGNDYSYIVNKSLEFYLSATYKNITFINQEKFIDHYSFGDHTFLMTHGKDQKYMKSPMPLNLDVKTDLWLLDYQKNVKSKFYSTIKGDLHNYSVNMGKSGRYVNVPSICGGSSWIEHNFGSSHSGALLEIVSKYEKNIISMPIWF